MHQDGATTRKAVVEWNESGNNEANGEEMGRRSKVATGVTDQDSKMAKVIRESRCNVKHEYNVNHYQFICTKKQPTPVVQSLLTPVASCHSISTPISRFFSIGDSRGPSRPVERQSEPSARPSLIATSANPYRRQSFAH
jgi:hypothetical protein